MKRTLMQIIKTAVMLADRLPKTDDPWFTWAIKGIAVFDVLHNNFYGNIAVIDELRKKQNLSVQSSPLFVRAFFDHQLHTVYKTKHWSFREDLELIEVKIGEEALYFQQWNRGSHVDKEDEFFHTPGFPFHQVMAAIWNQYPEGLYVSIKPEPHSNNQTPAFSGLDPLYVKLSAAAKERIDKLKDIAARRTYIALGPPGTGKSTFARLLAKARGENLLKLDTSILRDIHMDELKFLLDILKPGLVLIDDFDRVVFPEDISKLLFLMEYLHGHDKPTTVYTANNPEQMDRALLRSERIDQVLDFQMPDEAERQQILVSGWEDTSPLPESLIQDTEGFSQADLIGLLGTSKIHGIVLAMKNTQRIRELQKEATRDYEQDHNGHRGFYQRPRNGRPPRYAQAVVIEE